MLSNSVPSKLCSSCCTIDHAEGLSHQSTSTLHSTSIGVGWRSGIELAAPAGVAQPSAQMAPKKGIPALVIANLLYAGELRPGRRRKRLGTQPGLRDRGAYQAPFLDIFVDELGMQVHPCR